MAYNRQAELAVPTRRAVPTLDDARELYHGRRGRHLLRNMLLPPSMIKVKMFRSRTRAPCCDFDFVTDARRELVDVAHPERVSAASVRAEL